jgi:hypothetical protein
MKKLSRLLLALFTKYNMLCAQLATVQTLAHNSPTPRFWLNRHPNTIFFREKNEITTKICG